MRRVMPGLLVALALAACETEVKPPRVGESAPDFRLPADDGSEVGIADFRGRWVVLFFYPQDFSTGSTIQARAFQQDLGRYQGLDAVVLGVSLDDVESHARFRSANGLEFRLLADTDGEVSTAYGSIRGAGSSRFSRRNTFVIDPDGSISRYWLDVNPATHSDRVLDELSRSQGVQSGSRRFSPDRVLRGG